MNDIQHLNLRRPGTAEEPHSPATLSVPGPSLFAGGSMDLSWIKILRKMRSWEWYQHGHTVRVFLELLLTASFESNRFMGIELKPGQCVCGRESLAKTLRISEQNVRTALSHLILTNEITIQSTNKFSIVTICNWERYQGTENENNQLTNTQTNQQLTSNQPTTNHTQECKEGKKVRIEEREKGGDDQAMLAVCPSNASSINGSDASIPTIAEVITLGQFESVPESECRKFYDYHKGNNLWLNKYGRMIDVRTKLRSWGVRAREMAKEQAAEKPFKHDCRIHGPCV